MSDLDQLVDTLLFEGYALYPYTPGATKNATPTPFGIVYPPVYAQGSPSTFDHLRLQVAAEADADATLQVTALFLEPAGERHEGVERRVALPATTLAALCDEPVTAPFAFDAVRGRVAMRAQVLHDGLVRVTTCVHNTTAVDDGLDRPGALRASLLSTHVVATLGGGGRFVSPSDPPEHAVTANMTCVSVNTFPVLATPADDVILGAAIVLPDHPQIAPESRGSLFDSTEIEEALLLHLLALSDDEVSAIAGQDPAVREMLRRAVQTTPEEFEQLRGRVTMQPPGTEIKGEREVVADGVLFRLGDRVRLRPSGSHAPRGAQDHLLDGRAATIERIYIDYADVVHLCVTVDDDPGQALMRDIGRYLYFKPSETELLP
jgi:hypothetical protein